MLKGIGTGIAVALSALFAAAHQSGVLSQDPTTGTPVTEAVAPASAFGPAVFQSTGGGEVIGYTTQSVVPHFYTLDDLTQAFSDLVADGHTLVPIDQLTIQNLAPLDRLFVGLVRNGYQLSEPQIDVIETFVLHGGRLVFLGENNTFFHENNVAVGSRFRIGFPLGDPPQTILTDVNSHPITQGPYGAVAVVDGSRNSPGAYGSMLGPGPSGFSLIDFTTGESAGRVIEPGVLSPTSGLVVAYAEVNIWTDNAYLDGDNRALWRNTFAYAPAAGANAIKPALRALEAQSGRAGGR